MDAGTRRKMESAVRRVQYELRLPYAALFDSRRFANACTDELQGFDLLYERMSWVSYGGALASRRLDIPLVLENNGDHLADLEAKGIAPRGAQYRLSAALMGRTVTPGGACRESPAMAGATHSFAAGTSSRTA